MVCHIIMNERDRKVLSELCQKLELLQSGSGVGIPPCLYILMHVLAAQWEEVLYPSFYLL